LAAQIKQLRKELNALKQEVHGKSKKSKKNKEKKEKKEKQQDRPDDL
jgi:Sec-independent protein translocase protein TatA